MSSPHRSHEVPKQNTPSLTPPLRPSLSPGRGESSDESSDGATEAVSVSTAALSEGSGAALPRMTGQGHMLQRRLAEARTASALAEGRAEDPSGILCGEVHVHAAGGGLPTGKSMDRLFYRDRERESNTPRNGNPVNGNHLDICLSFPQKNRN